MGFRLNMLNHAHVKAELDALLFDLLTDLLSFNLFPFLSQICKPLFGDRSLIFVTFVEHLICVELVPFISTLVLLKPLFVVLLLDSALVSSLIHAVE